MATVQGVAAPEELERVIERHVSAHDLKQLKSALALIADRLDPNERVLGAAAGAWFSRKRCLVVATSRSLTVADGRRIESLTYAGILQVEYSEGWRKGHLVVRAPGLVADIRDIHLDRARELNSIIHTARLNRGPVGLNLG
jgi:hypothetical protein